MTEENLGQDLGRLFEVGFNAGILTYIEQNQFQHNFGDLYRQDLRHLSFQKILRRLADKEKVISEEHRKIVEKWSLFFLEKGFLSGLNFLGEYIQANGWSQYQLKRLKILYYQCCFSDENSIGTYGKGKDQAFREVLAQFEAVTVDISQYSGKGEFLNADTLILLQCGNQYRVLCVDLSVFSIKSIRDLVDVNSIEVLRNLLLSEISYLKSKSVFSNLSLDTKDSGFTFYPDIARYFTAFKREDKESVKLIQAASYTYSFFNFLRSHHLLTDTASIVFNIVGYSDRNINAMSVNSDNLDVLATCSHIYQNDSSPQEIQAARQQVLNLIKRNASSSFQEGRNFVKQLLEVPRDQITSIVHREQINDFCNSIDLIPPHLATQLQVSPSLDLREAHAELIQQALTSNQTYLFLTGNPGIGKTTAIAQFLQSEQCLQEGFLFLYISPRIQVNLDIIEKFTNSQTNLLSHDSILTLITNADLIKNNRGKPTVHYRSNLIQGTFTEQAVHFLDQQDEFVQKIFYYNHLKRVAEDEIQEVDYQQTGVLASLCKAIYTTINRQISNHIVATVSIQSLKKTQTGQDTLQHFKKIFQDAYNEREDQVNTQKMQQISSRIKHLFIMIDEITGDNSGVDFLNEMTSLLKKYGLMNSQCGFNTKVIVADASIIDPTVINQHLSETSAEPNKIFFRKAFIETPALSVQEFLFKNHPASIINANSYPAKSLDITYKIFIEAFKFNESTVLKKKKDLTETVQSQIVEDIKNLLQQPNSGQIIVYIQHKPRLADLIEKFKDRFVEFNAHSDYLEIHADLSQEEKKEIHQHKNNVKVIFMTASASRGLSFPQVKHILVDIPRFEIEKNLMEIIQVIYRGRGDKILDAEAKEIIFYLSEQAIYYQNEPEVSLQESILNVLNILLILKTSIMTRIRGSGQIGRDHFMMIPIGGKSIFAAGQTFSSKMSALITQLKKAHKKYYDHKILREVYTHLEQLLSHAEIVVRETESPDREAGISYLLLRKSLIHEFLKVINHNFEKLLDFTALETGYISGSLLLVPVKDKSMEATYRMRFAQGVCNIDGHNLLNQLYQIRRQKSYPERLRSAISEAISLVKLLQENPYKTQRLEQESQYFDQYYALPLFTFISSESISRYFGSYNEEPEDKRFRDILESYLRTVYPVSNILPIGHRYKDFPFMVFRSYSLTEMRAKIFTDKYLLNSQELNLLNLILSQD